MNLVSIFDFNQSLKTVFLRCDFNVPFKNGIILDSKRIDEILPTISYLIKNKNKLVIASHLGRPDGQVNEKYSLKIVLDYLRKELKDIKINFVQNFGDYKKSIDDSDFGDIILLENIRFLKEEENNDIDFKKFLADPIDIFCNEAFSCSHRAHASIMLAELFDNDEKFVGQLFFNEIKAIDDIFHDSKNAIAIIGGSKISTKIKVLEKLKRKVKKIIIVGAMANTFFYSMGLNVGKSLYEKDYFDVCKELLLDDSFKLVLPTTVVVTDNLEDKNFIKEKSISDLDDQDIIVDIGTNAVKIFIDHIKESKLVLWNGPLGIFEIEPFNQGTINLAEEIANLTDKLIIKSVIGGGDTASALKDKVDFNRFSHVSTAGGAFLEYIENDGKLPGILALTQSK